MPLNKRKGLVGTGTCSAATVESCQTYNGEGRMALYLTNIAALRAQSALADTTRQLNTVYQRLASGLRINSAKDDPAGLQISNRLTSQIDGLKQGSRNAADGQALANTAEGALEEITNMLQRIRTLSIQAANGTNTTQDRLALNEEVIQLSEEITRISCRTTFGGAKILCGLENSRGQSTLLNAAGKISIQVGADAFDTIDIDLSQGFALSAVAAGANVAAGNGYLVDAGSGTGRFSVSTTAMAQQTLLNIDKFIANVDSARARLGAVSNRFDSVLRLNDTMMTNLADARSRIRDTDYAEETANLIELGIRQQASTSVLVQAMQNQQNMILSLLDSI